MDRIDNNIETHYRVLSWESEKRDIDFFFKLTGQENDEPWMMN